MEFDLIYRRDPDEFTSRQANAALARASLSNVPGTVELALTGRINRAKADAIIATLDAAPAARSIRLVVDSKGGEFVAAFDFFVSLHNHAAEQKMATIIRAESSALLVALGCDHRIAVPDATITVHPVRRPFIGEALTAAQARELADSLAWLDRQVAEIVAYRTGTNISLITAEQETEAAAPLDWCLAHNIIHEVANG